MMQREVADRLAAAPGVRDYGLLSATTQMHAQVDSLFTLPPTAFSPPPDVFSTVLRLEFAPRFAELGVDAAGFDALPEDAASRRSARPCRTTCAPADSPPTASPQPGPQASPRRLAPNPRAGAARRALPCPRDRRDRRSPRTQQTNSARSGNRRCSECYSCAGGKRCSRLDARPRTRSSTSSSAAIERSVRAIVPTSIARPSATSSASAALSSSSPSRSKR